MLETSLSHDIHSINAHCANVARIILDRTNPKGIASIIDDLRKQLERDLDPDKMGTEMQWDKGYGKKNMRVKHEAK